MRGNNNDKKGKKKKSIIQMENKGSVTNKTHFPRERK
jgi:hypothetical protein